MKSNLKSILSIALFLSLLLMACSSTPEGRVEKVINKYLSDLQKGNLNEADNLLYDASIADMIEESSEEPLTPTLSLSVNSKSIIKKDSKFKVLNITKLYPITSSVDSVELVACDSIAGEYEPTPEKNEKTWPSDVLSAYSADVDIDGKKVNFIVVQIDEKNFKIYAIKGLYEPDLSKIEQNLRCEIEILEGNTDEDHAKNVDAMVENIEYFDLFANSIANNDSVKILRLFPVLKDYKGRYNFKGKPVIKNYKQLNEYGLAVIECADSTAYVMRDGKIVDCQGIINTDALKAEVMKLGESPRSQADNSDLEYISILESQIDEINEEKERKAKAAKYQAQGVALISSEFSNNGNGAKGVKFSALNTSNKTAKYIIMEVVGYNSVDDPVWSDGYLKRCRGIGPIESGEGGEWDFDNIWERGDLVKSYEIKTLIIQFTDGTSKSVRLPRRLPDDWRKWLY